MVAHISSAKNNFLIQAVKTINVRKIIDPQPCDLSFPSPLGRGVRGEGYPKKYEAFMNTIKINYSIHNPFNPKHPGSDNESYTTLILVRFC